MYICTVFLIMEKGGTDLYDFLDTQHAKVIANEPLMRKIVSQTTLALDHCHSRGVVHRDLKPEVCVSVCAFLALDFTFLHS